MWNQFKELVKDVKTILIMLNSISKSYFPISILYHLLQTTLPFVNIVFSAKILDLIITNAPLENSLYVVYWMVGLNLFLGVLIGFFNHLTKVRGKYLQNVMESQIAIKALTLDYEQLEKKDNLEILYKAKEGSNSNGGIITFCDYIGRMFGNVISLIYSIILLSSLFTDLLAILLFCLFFLALYINTRFIKKINQESYAFFEKNIEGNRKGTYFLDLANNYKVGKDVRIYQMSELIEEEVNNAFAPFVVSIRDLGRKFGKYSGYSQIVNQITVYLTYAYVGVKAIRGSITIGATLQYVSSLVKFMSALSSFIELYAQIDLQRQYLKNYSIFLELENKKYEGTLPIEKRDDNQYELEFKNVSFHYPNSEEMILKNISLKLKISKKMAIVGKNGAGKTTFIKLLCRLYDPTEGEILLNGINIQKYDYKEYLQLFSVVFQDFKLFSFELGQNVATNIEYFEEKVWEVLEEAGVSKRVKSMKDGLKSNIYQTQEEGLEISGGEAQKLAIARALYKDSPVVILDEPTSALDPVAEYEIYAKFDELVSEKTSIYISHRMSSCRFCDNIVVFDRGEIVQIGNHDTLIKEEGIYSEMWNAQAKYYVTE